ncbi:hypothetical protein EOA30_04785 [Mesorhizobium sp. M8A.F.Ca.ET.059.01.1.1]|nr:hypothetical protein EOA30_04785 [Mesorhizobium sp. M8A.F.Ca.ET.059.01.1.1]
MGFAIAETLSRLGARIAICDVSDEALVTASRMLEPEVAELADVSSEEDGDRLFTTVNPGAMEQLPPTDNDAALAPLHQLRSCRRTSSGYHSGSPALR